MAWRCVLVVVVAAAVVLASPTPAPGALTRNNPGWPCPIQTQIAPCKCSEDTEYNLHLDCSLANSDEELLRIFSSTFPFNDFYELKIIHDHNDVTNVIDEITANTFADLTFERIIITGTRLEDINDEAFADSHATLKYLELSNNYLYTVPFESLALYLKLHTFILDDNAFPFLFDLESGSLEVFSANRNHNMKMTSSSQFTLVPSLRELYLSEIGLTELQTGLFNNMTQLEVVDFSKNHLTTLEAESIKIQGNTIRRINFDTNEISFIRHDAFLGLRTDAILSLAENQLEVLEEEHWKHIFQQITNRETIDLRGNQLVCGCDIDWLFMQYKEEYLCRLTDTTLCATLQQTIFLDVIIFCDQCGDSFVDCPPQTDCKNPGTSKPMLEYF